MRPICFISDYGLAEDLVGLCKGVMASIAPEATIVDIAHDIRSFDVLQGAETLRHATRYMPEDAVYLTIVDPGKSERRGLALQTGSGAFFVGPDNGLLLPASEALGGVVRAAHLTNEQYHVRPVSPAVHGRDIFSPVAAYLAAGGIDLNDLGEEIDPNTMVSIDFPTSRRELGGTLVTRIIHINRFGNVRLSAMQEDLDLPYGAPVRVRIGDETMNATYERTFGGSKEGDLILVADSHWRLSLAVNKGSAARALMLEVGDEVRIEGAKEAVS